MERIKICHFILGLHNGGVEKVLENYFSHMDRTKYELHLVTHMPSHPDREKVFKDMGFHIHELSEIRGSRPTPTNFREYSQLFRQHKFDIVHNHFPNYPLPLFFARWSGVKVRLLHSHNDYAIILAERGQLKKHIYNLGMKLNARNATFGLACSKIAGESVFGKDKWKRNNMLLLPNAVETHKYSYSEEIREKYRSLLKIHDELLVGHVGRYEGDQKNHEFVLATFAALKKKMSKVKLLMVGEGPRRKEYEEMAENLGLKDDVIFTGAVQNVQNYYQAMDVFVFPSRFEGLGIVLVEAQIAGLYCLASQFVPKEAVITDNVSILDISAPEVWANTIMEHRTYERKSEEEAAIKAGYDISVQGKVLDDLYQSLV